MKYITIKKYTELTGYSPDAVRSKIKRGIWIINKHFIKAPDSRILLIPEAIEKWAEGKVV